MWSKRPKPCRNSGFTLTEVMIALVILLVVLVLSMSLLFSLRTFAVRQQMFAEPRQGGRQAVEYIAENLRQAGVIGMGAPGFEGVVVPFVAGSQACWNDVTNATYADLHTDIICITRPNGNSVSLLNVWPGFANGVNFQVSYSRGCAGGDANNRSMFLDETGAGVDPHSIILIDGKGQMAVAKITPWADPGTPVSHCSGSAPAWSGSYIAVTGNVIAASPAPGGGTHPDLVLPAYASATSFYTLRVKNGRLQQKAGWIDTAAPDAGFTDLMENVVDFQVSYFMANGAVFNNTAANLMPTPSNIPKNPDAGDALSSSNIMGFGIHVVTRSAAEAPITMRRPTPFPLVADRTVLPPTVLAGTTLRRDRCFYYQAFTNALVRNRVLGF